MTQILIVGADPELLGLLAEELGPDHRLTSRSAAEELLSENAGPGVFDAMLYFPSLQGGERPDLVEASKVLTARRRHPLAKVVAVSSAAVYGASHHNTGLVPETRATPRSSTNRILCAWIDFEELVHEKTGGEPRIALTILRPAAMPRKGGPDYLSRLMSSRLAPTLAGHDPSIQILAPRDLAAAIAPALLGTTTGCVNVVPTGVIPLHAALRLAGAIRIPIPWELQWLGRKLLAPLGLAASIDQLEFIRYSWTASAEKARRELGFTASKSSGEALASLRASLGRPESTRSQAIAATKFDDFGLNPDYIAWCGRWQFRFMSRVYWRIEVDGIENLPREGGAVLVGLHRGFMPFDATMTLDLILKKTGRIARFLIHPTLVKFPFLTDFMTRLGGIIACMENADWVLDRGEILGVYPEGIRGAFTPYKRIYKLGKFGRDEFVRMALSHKVPIIPFVTVGAAEIFPILGRIDWPWWKRYSEWPYFPITPTFPFLPVPLPTKWHVQFLPPMHVEMEHGPEAVNDLAAVQKISAETRRQMDAALQDMLRRRPSIFYGRIFEKAQKSR